MKRVLWYSLIGVVAVAMSVLSHASSDSPVPSPYSLTIHPYSRTVAAGSPVPISVTLKNTSTSNVDFARDSRGRDSHVVVRDVDGNLAPETCMGKIWNGHSSLTNPAEAEGCPNALSGNLETGTLPPGQVINWRIDASKFYEMKKPGTYTVSTEWGGARSNVVIIVVFEVASRPSLHIEAEGSIVKLGSPAWVKATLTNDTGHPVSVDREKGAYQIAYRVEVLDVNGVRASETPFGRLAQDHETPDDLNRRTVSSVIILPLAVGQSITDRVNVSRVYELSEPGHYTIQFQRFDRETDRVLLSNVIDLVIVR